MVKRHASSIIRLFEAGSMWYTSSEEYMQDCFCQLCGRSWWRYIHISYTQKGRNPQKKKSGKDPIYHLETFLHLIDLKSYVNIASSGSTDLGSGTHIMLRDCPTHSQLVIIHATCQTIEL
jgi:hypothetical protein